MSCVVGPHIENGATVASKPAGTRNASRRVWTAPLSNSTSSARVSSCSRPHRLQQAIAPLLAEALYTSLKLAVSLQAKAILYSWPIMNRYISASLRSRRVLSKPAISTSNSTTFPSFSLSWRLRIRQASTSSSSESHDDSDDPQKPTKPKAYTPLRRTASASLSIRSNPNPTRSSIQPIITLATAERYILPRISSRMNMLGVKPLHEAYWIPKWKFRDAELGEDKEAEIFIFGNGSFVCWGMTEEHAVMFQKEVLQRTGAEVTPFREAETEELEFVTDPSECVVSCFLTGIAFGRSRLYPPSVQKHATPRRHHHPWSHSCAFLRRFTPTSSSSFLPSTRNSPRALRILPSTLSLDRTLSPRSLPG